MELRVLTLNCWGLHADSKFIKERFKHIAEGIEPYDVVCFQEIWSREDYDDFVDRVSSIFPYSRDFRNRSFLGSGLCIFSKYPIVSVIGHQFEMTGIMRAFYDCEMLAGKGVLCCRVETPHGTVAVFNTHINPRCRETQLFELTNFINHVSGEDPVVLCGDFNTKDTHASYRLITECLELSDVYSDDPGVMTCDLASNIFTERGEKEKRIDFIFHSEDFTLVSRKLALTGHIPGKDYPYSDHEGVEAILSLSDESCRKKKERKNRKMSSNALLTLHTVRDRIKSKQQKYYVWPFSHRREVLVSGVVMQILVGVAVSLLISTVIHKFPDYQHPLVLVTTPISMMIGVLFTLPLFFIANEDFLKKGMAGNMDEIKSILVQEQKSSNNHY